MGGPGSGKSRYTAAIHAEIVRNLSVGAFRKHAAEAAGISEQTLNEWLEWGRDGREPYARFATECDQAIGEDAVRNQAIITKAAAGEHKGDWKAAAWNLEKKFPRLYGAMARGHELPAAAPGEVFSPWKILPPIQAPKPASRKEGN